MILNFPFLFIVCLFVFKDYIHLFEGKRERDRQPKQRGRAEAEGEADTC